MGIDLSSEIGNVNNYLELSEERRRFLRWLILAGLLPLPAGERLPQPFSTTFFQPWKEHATQSPDKWAALVKRTQQFGCQQIILQWVGISKPGDRWEIADETLKVLLEQCFDANIRLQIGLPYGGQWWNMLERNNDITQLKAYLKTATRECKEYLARTSWPSYPAFNGWYIPYEIEQYSWFDPRRRELLISWLADMSQACWATYSMPPGISTYLSVISNQDQLVVLWDHILAYAALRPMIQDGVGVSGLSNYEGLAPLHRLLLDRGVEFDLIIELFEQTSSRNGSEPFSARSAPFARVRRQLEIAETYGANNVVAFAVDPWMLGKSQSARRLHAAWRAVY